MSDPVYHNSGRRSPHGQGSGGGTSSGGGLRSMLSRATSSRSSRSLHSRNSQQGQEDSQGGQSGTSGSHNKSLFGRSRAKSVGRDEAGKVTAGYTVNASRRSSSVGREGKDGGGGDRRPAGLEPISSGRELGTSSSRSPKRSSTGGGGRRSSPDPHANRRDGGSGRSSLSPNRMRGSTSGGGGGGRGQPPSEGKRADESLREYWARREREAAVREAERTAAPAAPATRATRSRSTSVEGRRGVSPGAAAGGGGPRETKSSMLRAARASEDRRTSLSPTQRGVTARGGGGAGAATTPGGGGAPSWGEKPTPSPVKGRNRAEEEKLTKPGTVGRSKTWGTDRAVGGAKDANNPKRRSVSVEKRRSMFETKKKSERELRSAAQPPARSRPGAETYDEDRNVMKKVDVDASKGRAVVSNQSARNGSDIYGGKGTSAAALAARKTASPGRSMASTYDSYEAKDQFDSEALELPAPDRYGHRHQPVPSAHHHSVTSISSISESGSEDETSTDFSESRNSKRSNRAKASIPTTPAELSSSLPPNLHKDLANSSWPTLHHHLTYLSNRSDLILPTLTQTDPNDNSTPLHTVVWKAPPSLAIMLIRLLPTSKELSGIFMAKDRDSNTALHLCCANLDITETLLPTRGDKNGGLDSTVLEALVRSAPRALQMQNAEGDTPLHLLVTSPACTAPGSSHRHPPPPPSASDMGRRSSSKDQTEASERTDLALTAAANTVSTLLTASPDCAIVRDTTGATALHAAVANGAHERILLKLITLAPMCTKVEDERGMLPLHYVAAFLKTSVVAVRKIIEANPEAVSAHTNNGDTPLHLAVSNAASTLDDSGTHNQRGGGGNGKLERNVVKVVELLMGTGYGSGGGGGEVKREDSVAELSTDGDPAGLSASQQSPLLMTNREKLTPLHCCALFDAPPQLTKLLMKHPISQRAASMTNSFGATPLHLAAAQPGVAQSIATVVAIGTSEAASVQDRLKRTPLHVAAQNIHATSQLIKNLAELNQEATAVKTQRGHLPLHLAAQSQAKEPVIKALIRAFPKATEARNKSSNTPLHDAAKYRASAGVVKLLLDTYPDAVYIQNQYGNLPLHCATAYQAPGDVVQLLLKAWPEGASMQNRNQDAPLHYAAAYATSADAVKPLIDAAPAAVLLLNSSGQSPIDRAKANNAPEEIIELLEESAEEWTKKAASDGWGAFSPDFEARFDSAF